MASLATDDYPTLGAHRPRVTFIYLGTANAFASFVIELANASRFLTDIQCAFIVAADRPLNAELTSLGVRVLSVPAIDQHRPLDFFRRYFQARKAVLSFLDTEKPERVITLMPHVWSPVLAPAIKRRCSAYVTIVHDAASHPGDRSGWVTPWLLWDARLADSVVTLSRSVAQVLMRRRVVPSRRVLSLYHPHLKARGRNEIRQLETGRPLRLLFFGRILAYKGLPLLVEAIELLKARGVSVSLGVVGAGDIGSLRSRLAALDAEVINRTLPDAEVAELLTRYDAVTCSHIEASQSGVAALAFGNCMPVVATPVGGLVEQVIPGQTGVLAASVTPRALADAIYQLNATPGFYDQISRCLKEIYPDRSMAKFLAEMFSGTPSVDSRRRCSSTSI